MVSENDIIFEESEDMESGFLEEIKRKLKKRKTGRVVRIETEEGFDKATFKEESYDELNKLEKMLIQNGTIRVEISGHTDNIGKWAYNKELSQRRANAVKDYLVGKGIDTRRITAVGHGENMPLASNDDEKDGREINRRVEFKVIK